LVRRETGHVIEEVAKYESPTAQYGSHIHNIAYEDFAVQLPSERPKRITTGIPVHSELTHNDLTASKILQLQIHLGKQP
jgi:hypothetical protein